MMDTNVAKPTEITSTPDLEQEARNSDYLDLTPIPGNAVKEQGINLPICAIMYQNKRVRRPLGCVFDIFSIVIVP